MISDILSEALDQIQFYRAKYPHIYNDYSGPLEELASKMDSMRKQLDAAPEKRVWKNSDNGRI